MDVPPVSLGFVEEPDEDEELDQFPNKVGGKPVWLIPTKIPTLAEMTCTRCDKPLALLLQLYAPLDSVNPDAFHRVIYVFSCKNGTCVRQQPSESYVVLRSQLPKQNPYYSETKENDTTYKPLVTGGRTCRVSNLSAQSVCARCKRVSYASREFQKDDWENGHKGECPLFQSSNLEAGRPLSELFQNLKISEKKRTSKFHFKEFVVEIEADSSPAQLNPDDPEFDLQVDSESGDEADYIEAANMKALGQYASAVKATDDFIEEDFKPNKAAKDKFYQYFRHVIQLEPDQILRYYNYRNIEPLWFNTQNRPSPNSIPNCPKCSSPRLCEFQILPQLLYFLEVERDDVPIDWSTLVIYTCSNSCTTEEPYTREVLWQQFVEEEKEEEEPKVEELVSDEEKE